MVLTMTTGVMSFVTGELDSGAYIVNTPSATIGVRGTAFTVVVLANGFVSVTVTAGTVRVTAAGVTVTVGASGFRWSRRGRHGWCRRRGCGRRGNSGSDHRRRRSGAEHHDHHDHDDDPVAASSDKRQQETARGDYRPLGGFHHLSPVAKLAFDHHRAQRLEHETAAELGGVVVDVVGRRDFDHLHAA